MAKTKDRLNALAVQRAREPGLHHDGSGLYLQITRGGVKSWIYRFMLKGRARAMGLGTVAAVSLAQARSKAAECRALLQQGLDPIDVRRAQQDQARVAAARGITFRSCAEAYIASHRAAWRNPKSLGQWNASLSAYAHPVLGELPVQQIDVAMVMKVLEPIWTEKTETASRLRGRIEAVLNWAKTRVSTPDQRCIGWPE
jgi:hypothetical protein